MARTWLSISPVGDLEVDADNTLFSGMISYPPLRSKFLEGDPLVA
jgi:hypothetical protein